MTARKRLALSPDVRPWERQPGENETHYARFTIYRDLGDGRSLEQALEIWNATTSSARAKLTLGSIKQYSARFRWTERAAAWDAFTWEAERRRLIKLRQDAIERHRKQAMALQGKGTQALASMPAAALGPIDVLRYITEGARLELSALGEPTERVAHSGPTGGPVEVVDTSTWTPEQREKRFQELLAEMAHRRGQPPDSADHPDADDQVV